MRGQLKKEKCNIYYNILQVEKSQEAGFFSNFHQSIDLESLQIKIENKTEMQVGLRQKAIQRGKPREGANSDPIRAIYIKLDSRSFQKSTKSLWLFIEEKLQGSKIVEGCDFGFIWTW